MIEKTTEMNELLDWYDCLLTDKQQDVMNQYFKEDYSLSEIGENMNISRSAVSDLIHRTSKILLDYEKKLKLVEKFDTRSKIYDKMKSLNINEVTKLVYELEESE